MSRHRFIFSFYCSSLKILRFSEKNEYILSLNRKNIIILLMATMRQSLLSLGYVFILLLKMKDAAEVLNQRSIQQNKKTEEIK